MGSTNNDHYFLADGGKMGELIRAKDWSKTSLGNPDTWSPSLQTIISVVLNNPFAMYIAWGDDFTQLYNDSFLPILGSSKHPEALGIGAEITFSEIWETISPMFAEVMKGKAVSHPYLKLILNRNGFDEECYFNFSYSPIKKENGEVGGILVTVIETTEKFKAIEALGESELKVRQLIENAPFPIAVYVGKEMIIELANESIISLWGKGDEVIGKSFKALLPELDNQLVFEQINTVLETGQSFHTKNTPLDLTIDGKLRTHYFNYSLTPLYDINGEIYGVMNTGVDLTDLNLAKKKIEESERNLQSMVLQSPIGICVLDAETLISEIVNDSFLTVARKSYEEVAGKHYWDAFAEVKSTYESELQKVIKSGKPFYANEIEIKITRQNTEETVYFTFVYAPLKNIEGKVSKVAIWVLDNTHQVIARQKIEEADKRFRNTVKQAPVGITILRGSNYLVEVANETYLKLVGKEHDSFVGKSLFESLPEVEEIVSPLLKNVLLTGIPYHGNELPVPVSRYDKPEIFYFDFLYHPLKEEDGSISGILVTVTDVSEKVEARKKIELNEERLNIIVEASELGTWELNLKTKDFEYSQRYFEVITGQPKKAELSYYELVKYLHPDDLPIREKAYVEAMINGYIYYEARLIWNDKSIRWVEARGKVFYDSDHQPEKLLGTVRDITDEKNHQQELEESEKRFRTLLMQSPVPKAILKGENMIIEIANLALLKNIWRRKESDVLGKNIFEVFPELKSQKYAQLLQEVFTTGIVHSESESPLYLNDGKHEHKLYVDYEYAPMLESDNTISGIKITIIDVTEKVETRKKIEESEKKFRSLTESIPQLIWETDEKGNALFASGKWQKYTGIQPNKETSWKTIIHPNDLEENIKVWTKSLTTGSVYKADVRLKSTNGGYRWYSVIGEPVFDKDNKIIKWVGAFTDIQTEKAFTHELEKQVAERTKELEQYNIDLEKMNKELQSFAYISSHDLQEPLRKIQTFATQIIEKESQNLSESGKDKFQRMQNAAQRMQTLINDLLSYSRTSTQERIFEKIDFCEIVDEVKEDLREELEAQKASIECDKTSIISIIPFQFRQLLYNLISNSLKFSKPDIDTVIKITSEIKMGDSFDIPALDQNQKYCHISVSDNGIGFDQEYNTKIFEVFQRLHGREQYNGTGIGLAIVKKIVENHYGIITAKGEKNIGATFNIYIPVN
ncbi:PAS domain S-box protein [Flavobacterium hercynium]|uniref:histidine kinase n=1 Tax=Flavobacterium hercynium TaxID=387094 RepID=A0A226HG41_9FLAO|nr:PAS domain S-box protein [Flavobacterium hercynium]OXA93155.1 hypothetical protein B0A66_07725 [Flavobacterium hercynium]SMP32783.1 PAS domain S-box-containing protein [Flavobacterium hercynium]